MQIARKKQEHKIGEDAIVANLAIVAKIIEIVLMIFAKKHKYVHLLPRMMLT